MTYYDKYIKYKNKYAEAKLEYDNLMKCKSCNNNSCDCVQQNGGSLIQSGGNKPDLYLFKANWCGHCSNFMPVWNDINKTFSNTLNIQTFDVDNQKDNKMFKEHNIQGFPTLILIKNNEKIEYNGSRDLDSVTNFINSYT